jgi:peptidoglycan/LPS O-acetylase OafA/YrhL
MTRQGQAVVNSLVADSQQEPVVAANDARSRTHGRYEELEAYRGIAALLIVVFHAYQFSRQGAGLTRYVYEGTPLHVVFHNLEAAVAWFFVLSGFLVFLPFARAAIEQTRSESARGFLIRRAIRILPTYYIAILVVWSWRYAGIPGQWTDLIEHLTFTHIFDRRYIFWTIGPAWSLAVEVLFYVFVAILGPVLFRLCRRWPDAKARLLVTTGVVMSLALVSIAFKAWARWIAAIPETNTPVYFGPLAKLDTLAIGMLLSIAAVAIRQPVVRGTSAAMAGIGGVAVMAVSFVLRDHSEAIGLFFHTLNGLGFVLILAATVLGPRDSAWSRLLARPVLTWIGTVSYSVYLWHEPIMIELAKHGWLLSTRPEAFPMNAVLLCLLSLLAGTLSYVAIERSTMNLRYLFTREGRLVERYPAEPRRQRPI